MNALSDVRVIESPYVPLRPPTPGEDARRAVRHGMADVLAWLGQPVGPAPGEPAHVAFLLPGGTVVAHPETAAVIRGIS